MRQLASVFASAAVMAVATPSVAQTQPAAQPQSQPAVAKVADANQVICVKEEEIGSRLNSHKVCHTRSEWTQLHQEDRGWLERQQQQRGMSGN